MKEATFQAEIIKRKGCVEEIFWRFPHIGELIIDQLDNQSLTKTREVNKWWQNFVDSVFTLERSKITFTFQTNWLGKG